MSIEIIKGGKVVARSQNLRGVISYAGKHLVENVSIHQTANGSGEYHITFSNGAAVQGKFADYSILLDWITSRAKRWDISKTESSNDHARWFAKTVKKNPRRKITRVRKNPDESRVPPHPRGIMQLLRERGHTVSVRRDRTGSHKYSIDGGREKNALQMSNFFYKKYEPATLKRNPTFGKRQSYTRKFNVEVMARVKSGNRYQFKHFYYYVKGVGADGLTTDRKSAEMFNSESGANTVLRKLKPNFPKTVISARVVPA